MTAIEHKSLEESRQPAQLARRGTHRIEPRKQLIAPRSGVSDTRKTFYLSDAAFDGPIDLGIGSELVCIQQVRVNALWQSRQLCRHPQAASDNRQAEIQAPVSMNEPSA
jgi:hypothetical protein